MESGFSMSIKHMKKCSLLLSGYVKANSVFSEFQDLINSEQKAILILIGKDSSPSMIVMHRNLNDLTRGDII